MLEHLLSGVQCEQTNPMWSHTVIYIGVSPKCGAVSTVERLRLYCWGIWAETG